MSAFIAKDHVHAARQGSPCLELHEGAVRQNSGGRHLYLYAHTGVVPMNAPVMSGVTQHAHLLLPRSPLPCLCHPGFCFHQDPQALPGR